jgi:hypothetical protein
MATFVIRDGELVLKELAGPPPQEGKILGEAPMVISDCMSETRHMADGQYYTSKSAFRKATKAAGCVEVGNEMSTLTKARPRVQFSKEKRVHDIKQAVEIVRKRKKRRR